MVVQHVRFEALSALLGADVKPLDKTLSTKTAITPLDFVTGTVLGHNVLTASTPALLTRSLRLVNTYSRPYDAVKREFFVDMDEFFDPPYDLDFTDPDSAELTQCSRGGEPYNRPWGWYRMALKVRNKYPDGNTWLGPDGWRDHSAPGEWPVSYHGTSKDGAKGIIQSHYTAGMGDTYGRGVYSTPSLSEAQAYTKEKEFTSKNGKTYRVIMQNRINPLKREICKAVAEGHNYWLVPVAAHSSSQQEREIVEGAIRPYGILIQEATKR